MSSLRSTVDELLEYFESKAQHTIKRTRRLTKTSSLSSTGNSGYDQDQLQLQFQPAGDGYIHPLPSFGSVGHGQGNSDNHVENESTVDDTKAPSLPELIRYFESIVAVSQTSDGVDPYNHSKGPSISYVNQRGSSQNETSETYGGSQPPSVGAMGKVAASQISDGVDPYYHPKGPSLSDMNQRESSHNGTSETYSGGHPPSVGAMAKVEVSQTLDGADFYNHPQGPSLSNVNHHGLLQNGTPDQDVDLSDDESFDDDLLDDACFLG